MCVKNWFKPDMPDIPKAEPQAAPAAPTSAPAELKSEADTGLESISKGLLRKAKGKQGLMISSSNTGGGSSGTGLNL